MLYSPLAKVEMKTVLFSRKSKDASEPIMVTEMFHMGLDEFHLSKVHFGRKQLEDFLELIPVEYHNRIVLHTMHSLAIKHQLKGIHLYRQYRDRKITNVLRLYYLRMRYPEIQFSCSSGKLANLYEDSNFITEIILSPVFDSVTKTSKGYQSAFGEQGLKHALAHTKFTVIAFGGVTVDKIEKVREMGFDGIALKGAVWKSKDPLGTFKRVKEKINELQ